MELGAPEVSLADDCGDGGPVIGRRECHARGRNRKAVHEVDVIVARNPIEQRILARRHDLIPTHVRHGPAWCGPQSLYRPRQNAQTLGGPFFRSGEQQLHAEADPQHGLREFRQQMRDRAAVQSPHRIRCRADARQHDARCGFYDPWVGADLGARSESLECKLQGGEIGTAAVDDHRLHYSTPLVLGSSSPSR